MIVIRGNDRFWLNGTATRAQQLLGWLTVAKRQSRSKTVNTKDKPVEDVFSSTHLWQFSLFVGRSWPSFSAKQLSSLVTLTSDTNSIHLRAFRHHIPASQTHTASKIRLKMFGVRASPEFLESLRNFSRMLLTHWQPLFGLQTDQI